MATEQELAVELPDSEAVEFPDNEQNVVDSSDDENLRGKIPQKRKKEEKKARTLNEQIEYEEEKQREFFQLLTDEVARQKALSPAVNIQAKRRRPGQKKEVITEIKKRRYFIKQVSYEIERRKRVPQIVAEKVERRRRERDGEIRTKGKLKTLRKEARRQALQMHINKELELQRQRDSKMLYIRGFPYETAVEELKSLSNDIVDVSILKENDGTLGAVISFNTEAEAESNFKALQSRKLGDQPLILDFYGTKSMNSKVSSKFKALQIKKLREQPFTFVFDGTKSINSKVEEANSGSDWKSLFVSGIPQECAIDQVAEYFKTAKHIIFNKSPSFSTAKILFRNKKDAHDAYKANKEIELSGHKLTVLSPYRSLVLLKRKNRKAARSNKKQGRNAAKKLKLCEQSESAECKE